MVTTNVWYHVAGVRGTNFTAALCQWQARAPDGNVTFAQNYGTQPALLRHLRANPIGMGNSAGLLDEVSLYNRALSSNEVAAIYAAGAAGKCKPVNGLSITTQPQSQSVAAGSNALFTVAAAGAAPLSYQWQFNGGAIAGATNTNLALANVQPANGGSYTVVVTNSAACGDQRGGGLDGAAAAGHHRAAAKPDQRDGDERPASAPRPPAARR